MDQRDDAALLADEVAARGRAAVENHGIWLQYQHLAPECELGLDLGYLQVAAQQLAQQTVH